MQNNFLNKTIYSTTANYPGVSLLDSIAYAFSNDKSQHLNKNIVQICPQQTGVLSAFLVQKIKERFSNTKFHLHANVNILGDRFIFDASSNFSDEKVQMYINQLKIINDLFGKSVYSYHAGRRVISLEHMLDNALRLQDVLDTEVIVEGLYPERKNMWLVSSLDDYEWLASKTSFVLDLSHLQIVFEQEKKPVDILWVKDLITHKNCKEIHISSNDGEHDSHKKIEGNEWWIELLNNTEVKANIFTEENFK